MQQAHKTKPIGDGWQVARMLDTGCEPALPAGDALTWIPASVPGAVHYDLIQAGLLCNPFASSEAARAAEWVAETDWLYRVRFDLDDLNPEATDGDVWFRLEFRGIDTFADIWLNGLYLGSTENAYRAYAFEPDPQLLEASDNVLTVRVKAHGRMIASKTSEAARMGRDGPVTGLLGKSLIRRYQRSFFSGSSLLNLGTGVLGIGINKPVALHLFRRARIAGWYSRVETLTDAEARLSVEVTVDRTREGSGDCGIRATLRDPATPQKAVSTVETRVDTERLKLDLTVANPKRWWPAGYGRPDLYELTIELSDDATLLDVVETRIGLRTVELSTVGANGRPTFRLQVNGRKIHCRGYNLIPVDYIKVHGDWSTHERLMTLVHNANANTVRFWGGGAVEEDRLYGACDERGIMVWQDFFLHSNVYPDYDPEFVENFREECVGIVTRLRNHPSLVLLCGGNEQQEGWDEWGWRGQMDRFYGEPLVTELLPQIAAEYAPDVPYITNSPHGRHEAQSPADGDMHCWGNFYNSTKDPQFVTETCWSIETYSRPETLLRSMDLDVDRLDTLGWNKEWNRITGLPVFNRFPYSSYFDFSSLRGYLRALEIEQALADTHALSMLRLRSSSCNGIIYWPLNKGGPLFQFGCVDYLGYPMMSYYVTKRLFAGMAMGIYRDIDDIRVVGSNETDSRIDGLLRIRHFDAEGLLNSWESRVHVAPGGLSRLQDLPGHYRAIRDRTREVVHAELIVGETTRSEDTLFFCPLAEIVLSRSPLSIEVTKTGGDAWTLDIRAEDLCKMIEIETDGLAMFSDNYFPMIPGGRRRIEMRAIDPDRRPTEVLVQATDGEKGRKVALG